ncbi:uncharacterized protein N7477_007632 [Penicillium maclennaniae]|uniref:uncharacterized protein n=1 Tax=Penicillium maclennaniae TaxID=1343394 RepID=UPI00253FD15A|nr:uncharacterized protein N7477_007632 [Penicillium maclennaniae]KAJ5665184.1 hypothetical protein N7477_007632 [Penicillium maclennaniae]
MITYIGDTQHVDRLVNTLCQAADGFKNDKNERDRLIALKAAQDLVGALQKPRDAVIQLSYSPTQILCVRIGVDLDIFTTLTERNIPLPLEEIAAVKNADLMLTERVLRVLAGIGYLVEHDIRMYAANTMTRQMSTRESVATVKFLFDVGMPSLAKTPEYFRQTSFQSPTGTNNGPFQYGEKTEKSLWEWFSQSPESGKDFNTYMEGNRGDNLNWVDWFPVQERLIDGYQAHEGDVLLVDVAGGRGHELAAFEAKFPSALGRLILEDQPGVLPEKNFGQKIESLPFDLFKPQPIQDARIYYMKFILHDWTDAQCYEVLQHLRVAMKKGYSKLIIEEFVLPDKGAPLAQTMLDWQMMVFCSSMERTQDHWEKLLTLAGFQVVQFWFPPRQGQGIIEAEVA